MSKSPETLTIEECHTFLFQAEMCEETQHKKFCRDRNVVMILCMLDAGLRVNELVNMSVASFIFAGQIATALNIPAKIAKGGSERTIPMSARLRGATARAAIWWNASGPPNFERFAFTSQLGGRQITARQVQRIVNQIALKSIGRKIHPHILRHTFATRLMRTTNSRIVQQLLGHKQLTSTQIYTHPNGDDLLEAINSISI